MGDSDICCGISKVARVGNLRTSGSRLALGGRDDAIICMSGCELAIAIGDRTKSYR